VEYGARSGWNILWMEIADIVGRGGGEGMGLDGGGEITEGGDMEGEWRGFLHTRLGGVEGYPPQGMDNYAPFWRGQYEDTDNYNDYEIVGLGFIRWIQGIGIIPRPPARWKVDDTWKLGGIRNGWI